MASEKLGFEGTVEIQLFFLIWQGACRSRLLADRGFEAEQWEMLMLLLFIL